MILAAFSEEAMKQLDHSLSVAADKSPTVYIVLFFCLVVLGVFLWFMKHKDTQFIDHINGHAEAEDRRLQTMADIQTTSQEVASENIKTVTEAAVNSTAAIRENTSVLARVEGRL